MRNKCETLNELADLSQVEGIVIFRRQRQQYLNSLVIEMYCELCQVVYLVLPGFRVVYEGEV
jgi:hypothetical protein